MKTVYLILALTMLVVPFKSSLVRMSLLARARKNRSDLIYNNYLKGVIEGIF